MHITCGMNHSLFPAHNTLGPCNATIRLSVYLSHALGSKTARFRAMAMVIDSSVVDNWGFYYIRPLDVPRLQRPLKANKKPYAEVRPTAQRGRGRNAYRGDTSYVSLLGAIYCLSSTVYLLKNNVWGRTV